jgi:NADH:ubiquinone oxidoreductase subunit F (NADH-binding)/ferredoxin
MERDLAGTSDALRFRVDPTRCDGQGVCVLISPEAFALDRYDLAYVVPGVDAEGEERARALEAAAQCPRNAISVTRVVPRSVRAPGPGVTAPAGAVPRLTVEGVEQVAGWKARGGFSVPGHTDLAGLVERSGLLGQGGAAFPTATKWRAVAGKPRPLVVANGAEREPGTVKDRYLMAHRPALVVDGLRLAMRAVGADEGVLAVDEDAVAEHDALVAAIAEAKALGLLDGCAVRTYKAPTRYLAGEETALLALIDGGDARPRSRPPFPSDVGVAGRPTLVQNVETLAHVAATVALGEAPQTGLFSVGPFGGTPTVLERPYGYPLRSLLADAGLLDGLRAVLVGGYAGGLLAPDALDVRLTGDDLAAAGAALGTKSVQALGADQCPVGAVARIVGYFAEERADQCPPCSRGLPDMAALLREIEAGTGGTAAVADLKAFMSTLFDRGICRLPDGAARVVMSLLGHFPDEVARHAADGCPDRPVTP